MEPHWQQQVLKAESYLFPEEDLARLDFEDGSFYRGGWSGTIGFTPLRESGSTILESLDVKGCKSGAGHQRFSDGSEYFGYFSDGLPHGYGVLLRKFPKMASSGMNGKKIMTGEVLEGCFRRGKVSGPAFHTASFDKGSRTTFGWFSAGKLEYRSMLLVPLLVFVRAVAGFARSRGEKAGRTAEKRTAAAAKAGATEKSTAEEPIVAREIPTQKAKRQEPPWTIWLIGAIPPFVFYSWFYLHQYVLPRWLGYLYFFVGMFIDGVLAKKEGLAGEKGKHWRNPPFMIAFGLSSCFWVVLSYAVMISPIVPVNESIIFFIVATIALSLYYVTNHQDPGYLPKYTHTLTPGQLELQQIKTKVDVCETCAIVRVPRSKHCKHCNRCVDHFDHHCPAVHHCIGVKNHPTFVVFCTFFCSANFLFATGAIHAIRLSYSPEEWEAMSSYTFASIWLWMSNNCFFVGGAIYNIICGTFVASLAIYHSKLVLQNLTTNEGLNWKKYPYLQKEKKTNKKYESKANAMMDAKSIGMSSPVTNIRNRLGERNENGEQAVENGVMRDFPGTNVRVMNKKQIKLKRESIQFHNPYDKGFLHNIKYALFPPQPRVESLHALQQKLLIGDDISLHSFSNGVALEESNDAVMNI